MMKLIVLCAFVGSAAAQCHSVSSAVTDDYCVTNCNAPTPYCPAEYCSCADSPLAPGGNQYCVGIVSVFDAWCDAACNHEPRDCSNIFCTCDSTPPPPRPTLSCVAKDSRVNAQYCVDVCGQYCDFNLCDCSATPGGDYDVAYYASTCPGFSDSLCMSMCNSYGGNCPQDCCTETAPPSTTPLTITAYDQDVCCDDESSSLFYSEDGMIKKITFEIDSGSISDTDMCGMLQSPVGITLDSDGNAFIADSTLGRVVRVPHDCDSEPIEILTSATSPIVQPQTLMIADGSLVIVDIDRTIYRVDLNDDFGVRAITNVGRADVQLTDIESHDGDIWYVANNARIVKGLVDPETFVNSQDLNIPDIADFDVNHCGLFFTTNHGQLWKCADAQNGTTCELYCDATRDSANCNEFHVPHDISVDCECNVYIANTGDSNVVVTDGNQFNDPVEDVIASVFNPRIVAYYGESCD